MHHRMLQYELVANWLYVVVLHYKEDMTPLCQHNLEKLHGWKEGAFHQIKVVAIVTELGKMSNARCCSKIWPQSKNLANPFRSILKRSKL